MGDGHEKFFTGENWQKSNSNDNAVLPISYFSIC